MTRSVPADLKTYPGILKENVALIIFQMILGEPEQPSIGAMRAAVQTALGYSGSIFSAGCGGRAAGMEPESPSPPQSHT